MVDRTCSSSRLLDSVVVVVVGVRKEDDDDDDEARSVGDVVVTSCCCRCPRDDGRTTSNSSIQRLLATAMNEHREEDVELLLFSWEGPMVKTVLSWYSVDSRKGLYVHPQVAARFEGRRYWTTV